jgi:NADH-quinone oxidoreductase subunit G
MERDGTFTSAERRVQLFHAAVPPLEGTRPDFAITAQVARESGVILEGSSPAVVFDIMTAEEASPFARLSYARLADVHEQWPIVGRGDLYYGGTTYENTQGLGAHLALPKKVKLPAAKKVVALRPKEEDLLAVPVTRLYDHGTTVYPSALLRGRIGKPFIALHPDTAARLGRHAGEKLKLKDVAAEPVIRLDESISTGVALLPRSMGLPLSEPTVIHLPAVRRGAKG